MDIQGGVRKISVTARRVVVLDGMVIGRWDIVLASRRRHQELSLVGLGERDPLEYVLEDQGDRLKGMEKARAIAKCAMWMPRGRPSKFDSASERKGDRTTMLAKSIAECAGVSVRSVVRAKKELRMEQDALPDPETDHSAALRRIEELEEELESSRLIVQDYADRALPKSQLSVLAAKTGARCSSLRRKLRKEVRRRRVAERNSRVQVRVIRKLEGRLEAIRKRQ